MLLVALFTVIALVSADPRYHTRGVFRQDCQWFAGQPGPCSATCGQGFRTRPLHITKQSINGGRPCPSPASEQIACVGLPACPAPQFIPARPGYGGHRVDCEVWYDDWSACSATCGEGVQTRTGKIEAYAQNGGLPCPPTKQTRPCNVQQCYEEKKYPVDCTRLQDGDVVDPVEKCSHKFYSCANGKTFERKCYGTLYFDVETGKCDQYHLVYACSGKRRPPPTLAPYSTAAPVTPAPELDCTSLPNGGHVDPVDKCSKRYFVCSNGVTNKMDCPADMYYDVTLGDCDRWINVFDCSGQQRVEPTPFVTEVPKTPAPVPIDCSTLEDGNQADPQQQCSSTYYTCTNKIGYKRTCPGNTFYDAEFLICDIAYNIPVCSGNPRPTPPPACKDSPRQVVLLVTLSVPIDFRTVDLRQLKSAFAITFQCSPSYLISIQDAGYGQIRIVANYAILGSLTRLGDQGLVLTIDYQQIFVQKVSVQKTIGGGDCETPTRPKPTYPFSCEDLQDGNQQAGQCEGYYWSCSGGETEKMACPEGTKYDVELDECEQTDFNPGCGGVRRTPAPPVQVLPTEPSAYDCEQKADGLYPDAGCSQTYFACSNGFGVAMTCPGKTHFDVDEGRCNIKSKILICKHGSTYGSLRSRQSFARQFPKTRPAFARQFPKTRPAFARQFPKTRPATRPSFTRKTGFANGRFFKIQPIQHPIPKVSHTSRHFVKSTPVHRFQNSPRVVSAFRQPHHFHDSSSGFRRPNLGYA